MRGELSPLTEAGTRFVALAEEHAADFATPAGQDDREGSFPSENIEALHKSGFMGRLCRRSWAASDSSLPTT